MENTAVIRYQKTPKQRAEIVAGYQQSGLGLKEFAAQQGLCYSSLVRWVRQNQNAPPTSQPELIEVPNLLSDPSARATYRVRFPQGLVLELDGGFDPRQVGSLAKVLLSL